jgi:hypothetical protein
LLKKGRSYSRLKPTVASPFTVLLIDLFFA